MLFAANLDKFKARAVRHVDSTSPDEKVLAVTGDTVLSISQPALRTGIVVEADFPAERSMADLVSFRQKIALRHPFALLDMDVPSEQL